MISIHYQCLFQTSKYLFLPCAHYERLFTFFLEKLGLNFDTILLFIALYSFVWLKEKLLELWLEFSSMHNEFEKG
jgi:hypothetical protein